MATIANRLRGAVGAVVNSAPPGQADAVIRALGRFLSSFGSRVNQLMKVATNRLSTQDDNQTRKMKSLAVNEIMAQSKASLEATVNKYRDGRIDLAGLRTAAQGILRRQTIAAAIVGVGGVGNLTDNVLTAIRRQLTEQFKALDGFMTDISARAVTQRDVSRLAMYSSTTFATAQLAQRQFSYDTLSDTGGLEERRLLGGSDQCDDCIELAGEGWQPQGSLPAIGQDTVCGVNCRCTFEVRVVSSETAAGSKGDSAPVDSG